MSGERLFISDCHLDPGRPQMVQMLANFLEDRAAGAAQLFILGDLFEAWLGDDDDAAEFAAVIDRLANLSKTCDIFFMAGNRDFLVGQGFADRVGLSLLEEPHHLELGPARVTLVHGDSLCTDDHDYQAFRRQVRNPDWQTAFLSKPLTERKQIAAELRRNSVAAMSEKSSEIMDVNETAVTGLFQETGADLILHGHTHRPALHQYSDGHQRLVLGDWVEAPSYASWTAEAGFQLVDPRLA